MNAPKISKAVSDLLVPDALRGGDDDEEPKPQEEAKPRKDLSEVEKLLTPKNLIDVVDPLEGTTAGLTPDALRGGEDKEPDELPAKVKTPIDEYSMKEIQADAEKLFKHQDEYIKMKEEAIEEKKVSIKEWAKKNEADDLTPDQLKGKGDE